MVYKISFYYIRLNMDTYNFSNKCKFNNDIDFNSQTITNINATSGSISGCDLTVGSGKTLDISDGTFVTSTGLENITSDEITQLQNIGTNTVSSTQWGYIGALDQTLTTSASPSFTGLTLSSSDLTLTNGNIMLIDNKYIKIGTGYDLQLYHDGSDSHITNATGDLYIKLADASGTDNLIITDSSNTRLFTIDSDGNVLIGSTSYNSCKFEVSAGKVSIWGNTPDSSVGLNEYDPENIYNLMLLGSGGSGSVQGKALIGFNQWPTLDEGDTCSSQFGAVQSALTGYCTDFVFLTRTVSELGGTLTEKMRIKYDGKIGIGTNSPSYTFDVTGDINFTGTLYKNGSAYSSTPWTTTGDDIYYSTGNVGIGNSSPSYDLDVTGNVNFTGTLYQNGSAYSSSQWTTSGSNLYYTTGNVSVGSSTSIGKLYLVTGTSGNTYDYSSQSSGSLAFCNGSSSYAIPLIVGKSTTNTGLHLSAGTSDNNTAYDMEFSIRESDNSDYSTLTTGGIAFRRYTTYLMHILRNGNVGVGLDDPSEKLVVYGSIKIRDSDYVKIGTGDDLQLYHDGSNSYITNATGDLNVKLSDNAGANSLNITDSDNSDVFIIDSDGTMTAITGIIGNVKISENTIEPDTGETYFYLGSTGTSTGSLRVTNVKDSALTPTLWIGASSSYAGASSLMFGQGTGPTDYNNGYSMYVTSSSTTPVFNFAYKRDASTISRVFAITQNMLYPGGGNGTGSIGRSSYRFGNGYFTNLDVTNLTFSNFSLDDGNKMYLGTDDDMEIYHSGTHGYMINTTGDIIMKLSDSSGTNELSITDSNDVEISYIDSDGNSYFAGNTYIAGKLGIGNSNPVYVLDVTGDINFTGDIYQNGVLFSSGSGELTGSIVLSNGTESSDTPTITGTSETTTGLAIISKTIDDNYTTYDMLFKVLEDDGSDYSTTNGGGFSFTRYNTSLMRILRNGNIGIGTTTPTNKLEVDGNIKINDSEYIKIGTSDDLQLYHNGTNSFITNATGDLNIKLADNAGSNKLAILDSDSTEVACIDSDGNMGLGNSSPSYKLDITGSINVTGDIYRNGFLTTTTSQWTTSGSNIYFSSGNVGIGTTSPSEELEVDGNIKINDSDYIKIGTGDDLQLYHDATNSYISNNTGDLIIQTDSTGAGIILDAEDDTVEIKYSGIVGATFSTSGLNLVSGDAYYINSTSVLNATTLGSGIVTSSLTSLGTLNGDLNIEALTNNTNDYPLTIKNHADNYGLEIGAYGMANNTAGATNIDFNMIVGGSYIMKLGDNAGSKKFNIKDSDDQVQMSVGTTGILDLITGGYYSINGTSVLNTTTLGSGVTASSLTSVGTLTSLSTGDISMVDNKYIKLGTSNDLQLYHNGSNSYITNATGNMIVKLADSAGSNKLSIIDSSDVEQCYINSDGLLNTATIRTSATDYASLNGTTLTLTGSSSSVGFSIQPKGYGNVNVTNGSFSVIYSSYDPSIRYGLNVGSTTGRLYMTWDSDDYYARINAYEGNDTSYKNICLAGHGGSVIIGSNTSTAPANSGKMSVFGNVNTYSIYPTTSNTYDIGSSTYIWNDLYINDMYHESDRKYLSYDRSTITVGNSTDSTTIEGTYVTSNGKLHIDPQNSGDGGLNVYDPENIYSLFLYGNGGGSSTQGKALISFHQFQKSTVDRQEDFGTAQFGAIEHGLTGYYSDFVWLTRNVSAIAEELTEKMRLTYKGNVGIGTNTPYGKLNVFTGTSGTTDNIGSQLSGSISFANGSTSYAIPQIIGKSSTLTGLRLIGATSDSNSDFDLSINIREDDGTDYTTQIGGGIDFSRYATSLMRIDRSGDIGIGTTDMYGKLTINTGTSGSTSNIANQTVGTLAFANCSTTLAMPSIIGKSSNCYGLTLLASTDNGNSYADMEFTIRETDNTDFSTLNATGGYTFDRMGTTLLRIYRDGTSYFPEGRIWTTTSWAKPIKLDTASAIQFTKATTYHHGIGATSDSLRMFITNTDDNTTDSAHYYFNAATSGYITLGSSTASSYPLTVYGNASVAYQASSYLYMSTGPVAWGSGPISVSILSTYGIWIQNGTLAVSSDERIKENIVEIDDETSLDMINSIPIKQYTYKDPLTNQEEVQYGMIAQEVEEILPNAVRTSEGYVPNIRALCPITNISENTYQLTLPIEVTTEKIRIVDYHNKILEGTVIETSGYVLTVEFEETFDSYENEVYVWGTYVDDFKTLLKDKIFAVGLSAIQELYRASYSTKYPTTTITDITNKDGYVVEMDGFSVDDDKPYVSLCSTDKSTKVVGSIEGTLNNGYIRINNNKQGFIRVSNINGNITAGDLLCSSTIEGHVRVADDDIVRSSTIAKSLEDCDFTDDESYAIGENTGKLIACIYMCG